MASFLIAVKHYQSILVTLMFSVRRSFRKTAHVIISFSYLRPPWCPWSDSLKDTESSFERESSDFIALFSLLEFSSVFTQVMKSVQLCSREKGRGEGGGYQG